MARDQGRGTPTSCPDQNESTIRVSPSCSPPSRLRRKPWKACDGATASICTALPRFRVRAPKRRTFSFKSIAGSPKALTRQTRRTLGRYLTKSIGKFECPLMAISGHIGWMRFTSASPPKADIREGAAKRLLMTLSRHSALLTNVVVDDATR